MVATNLSVLVAIVDSSWLFFICKKRKLFNMKKKFFRRNGGLLLQQELNEKQVSTETVRIFSVEERKNTTKDYDESHILGKGGFDIERKNPFDAWFELLRKTIGVCSMEAKEEILDDKVVKERDIEQIKEVYELAKRCLRVKGCCEMVIQATTHISGEQVKHQKNGKLLDGGLSSRHTLVNSVVESLIVTDNPNMSDSLRVADKPM
ncbi:hypothetical protein Goshw_016430 [Gossypium schwendimanii]|uniref:Uncharacterized protein n=1 Tax=Gossypium schwendimanii TaxID=34291 RepID=A0A7J9LA87_GOSSC|nr:hypothetical protein [Gossypium schwendimanii]